MENTNIRLSAIATERQYTIDTSEVTYGNGQVQWGPNNDLPLLYTNCYKGSATLQSVINGTMKYVLGDNIEVNAAKWEKSVNRRGMTMRSLISAIALSDLIFGGYAIQVIYNKMGEVCELYPLDFGKCRINEAGTKVWYAKKWTKWSTKSEEFDAFGQPLDNNKPTQIYFHKSGYNNSIYPIPPYYGALRDVLTEMECSKYSLNSVANGFTARYIINFPENNTLTDSQKESLEDAIQSKFCGSEPEANFLMYWQNGDKGLEIVKIEGDETPERFIAIKDSARQNIFISMQATPVLFGLPNITNGFSTNEYRDAAVIFEKMVVDPIRDDIKESIDKVTMLNDVLTFTPLSLAINNGTKEE